MSRAGRLGPPEEAQTKLTWTATRTAELEEEGMQHTSLQREGIELHAPAGRVRCESLVDCGALHGEE